MATVTGGANGFSIGTIGGSSLEEVFTTGQEDAGGIFIVPGGGDDKIVIGQNTGKVTIDLTGTGQGNDVVEGFRPGDQVVVTDRNGDGKIDINDLQDAQFDSAAGGLVVQFKDGSTVTFKGITSLDDLNFVVSQNPGLGSGGGDNEIMAKAITKGPEVTITTDSYIKGTDGSDSILGNKQDNTIEGGKGDDLIDGGKGNDVFLIKELNQGHDTLVNLNIGDKLQVYDRNSDGKLDINDLDMKTPGDVDSALTHEGGNTTINFADGTKVTLEGVNIKSFSELNITLHGDDYVIFQ